MILEESGVRQRLAVRQILKAVMEMLTVVMESCKLHGPSFHHLTFDGEVGYGWLVPSATEGQWGIYDAWLCFGLIKGSQWPLLCMLLFYPS